MRRWVVILFVVCLVAVFSVSVLVWKLSNDIFAHLSVVRDFGNLDEERVLTAAESVDYMAITNSERFKQMGSENYMSPETYLSYTYANFVDKEVLDYYQTRYDYQQRQTSPKGVTLDYVANVTSLANARIFTETRKNVHNFPYDVIVFYDVDNSIPLATDLIHTSYIAT